MSESLIDIALARDPTCAAQARRLIRRELADMLSPAELADLLSVATELIDNAFIHGEGEIHLVLEHRADALYIEVIDGGHGAAPVIREQPTGGTGGWGLRIVDGIARAWGAHEGTTHVWAELALGPDFTRPGN